MNQVQDPNGAAVHWGRAIDDGLPFRGKASMYKNEDEYESKVSRICDFKLKKFLIDDPKDHAEYMGVMDKIANRWFRLFYIERQVAAAQPFIYLEWGEFYMQESGERKAVAAPTMLSMPELPEGTV
jgi:hypothetical protein